MNIKTKLYTKKQIREAIEFWTKILENTSPLIDALVEDFGYEIVFGKQCIIPSLKNIKTIYDLVNAYAFANKLVPCPIENDILGKCALDYAAMEFYNVLYTDTKENPSKYILLTQLGQDENGKTFYPPRIFVADRTLNEKMHLMSLVSIIAHEMIHQYVIEIGNGIQKQFEADYVTYIPYDEHKGEFAVWMNTINSKHGLNVCEVGSKSTYDKDSDNALKMFAGNDYAMNESTKSTDTMKIEHHENGYVEFRFL